MRIHHLFCVVLALVGWGCGSRKAVAPAPPAQDWFRITFGATDAEPADWSGSVEVTGGRVVTLEPWRFDKEDTLSPQSNSWKCSTRLAAELDPKYWWLGAIHIVPKSMKVPKGPLIPNGLYVALEGANEVRVKTVQGGFAFRPAEVGFGTARKELNGRAVVERVPAARNITAGDDMEDDFPSVVVDSSGAAWVVWTGYRAEKERLVVARADGSGRMVVGEGEFFRPALTAGRDGRLYLAVSVHTGNTWKIGVATKTSGNWSQLEMISAGGPDLYPRVTVDSRDRLWVVWQGFRDGRSRILARSLDGKSWQPEITVSENSRNTWEPAIAADSQGRVHFAWDAYDGGDYNIYYRMHDGEKLAAVKKLTTSPAFQAHASIACDKSGRVWVAWDEAGANWGKDTGFLIDKKNGAEALYEERRVQLVVLAESGTHVAKTPEGFFEQPELISDDQGNVWCLMRRRYTKLHEVWSQSLQRNRLQQYSFWDYVIASPTARGWTELVPMPLSFGRNDRRAAIAAAPGGHLVVAWAGDGRIFSKPYPFVKNEVYTSVITGSPADTPALEPFTEPASPAKPVHPQETEAVTRLRAARISTQGKQLRLLRGDMHRHTDLSFDGDIDGSLWDFYRYTIDAANFDYSALTDHNAGDDIEYFWWLIQKSNDLFHYPGRFSPIYAYERSLRFPNGHRNLVWAKRGVHTLPRSQAEEAGKEGAARLYEYLRKTGGLAMSHTSATLMGTDWRDNDPELEPLVEIYQGDRTSYEHEGAPRAARGNRPFTQPGGFERAGFVWNAWAKGYKLGVQSSSDHSSTHVSYGILLAEDNTREAVLQAIAARHSYAATDNILLDVRCDDHIQGDIFKSSTRPKLTVHIEGTAPVDKVDIIKNNRYVFNSRPGKASVELTFEDANARPGESYYYVRIIQRDGQVAWSSPMWITYEK
jgi:hypothetical protein